MTDVRALGYVRVRATDLPAWREFASEVIGFGLGSGPEEDALYLRLDEHEARIVVLPGDEDRVESVGWQVADDAALSRVRTAVESSGVTTRALSEHELAVRRVEAGFAFSAPGSTPTEIFHGPRLNHAPLGTAFGNRFVAGDLGLGHVVVPVDDIDAAFAFYAGVLGFHPRGAYQLPPSFGSVRMRFLGVNPRHHSLAILPSQQLRAPALVHVMVECQTLDEVGRALDRLLASGFPLAATLGRHTNDKMVSFYARTPGGWDLEVGCDGLLVDQASYAATEITADSYWGHAPVRG